MGTLSSLENYLLMTGGPLAKLLPFWKELCNNIPEELMMKRMNPVLYVKELDPLPGTLKRTGRIVLEKPLQPGEAIYTVNKEEYLIPQQVMSKK